MFKIATSFSTQPDTQKAASAAYQQLVEKIGKTPHFLFCSFTETYDPHILATTFKELAPQVPIHGGSSCMGVMTEAGFHSENKTGLSLLGIYDPNGYYGTSIGSITENPKQRIQPIALDALQSAHKEGETPKIALITASPGQEESLLLGMEQVWGPYVPTFGGSAADHAISGNWSMFSNGAVFQEGAVISTLFPSAEMTFSFHSGYEPTEKKAVITEGKGRTIFKLNGKPAAQVYNDWIHHKLDPILAQNKTNILTSTTLSPLGIQTTKIEGMHCYQLAHPETITSEQGLTLFSEIKEGTEVTFMQGSKESLIKRLAQTIEHESKKKEAPIQGALVFFCAGCMLTIQEQLDSVIEKANASFKTPTPFLGTFTFGEQGCFQKNERNSHSNLMISVVTFRSHS